jgi:hypothetical protein
MRIRHASLAIALCASVVACNAISGVDGVQFGAGGASSGSTSGSSGKTSTSGTGMGGATSSSTSASGAGTTGTTTSSTTTGTSTTSTSTTSTSTSTTSSSAATSASSGCVPKTCMGNGGSCGTMSDGCGGMLHCGNCTGADGCGVVTPNVCDNAVQLACGTQPTCPAGYTFNEPGFSTNACNPGTNCNPQSPPLGFICMRGGNYSVFCATACTSGSHIGGTWPAACCAGGTSVVCIPDPP